MLRLNLFFLKFKIALKMFASKNGIYKDFNSIQDDLEAHQNTFDNICCSKVYKAEFIKGKDVIMINGKPKLRGGRYLC